MTTRLTIPEWMGSGLTNASFLNFAGSSLKVYEVRGFDALALTDVGPQLAAAVDTFTRAVNNCQKAFDETMDVARADRDRDAFAKALWYVWRYLRKISPAHPLAPHVTTLRSEMGLCRRVWALEMANESAKIEGLQMALATDENRAALAALGLDKIAAALFAANDAVKAAQRMRNEERSARLNVRAAGSTPELRRAVAQLLVRASQRVNAVNEIRPSDASALAIRSVVGIIGSFKRIASAAKHRRRKQPAPPEEES